MEFIYKIIKLIAISYFALLGIMILLAIGVNVIVLTMGSL